MRPSVEAVNLCSNALGVSPMATIRSSSPVAGVAGGISDGSSSLTLASESLLRRSIPQRGGAMGSVMEELYSALRKIRTVGGGDRTGVTAAPRSAPVIVTRSRLPALTR